MFIINFVIFTYIQENGNTYKKCKILVSSLLELNKSKSKKEIILKK